MKSAIILAAGIGSRLFPLTKETPKCCIEVSGKSIIRRITDQLLSCDPHMEIIVVAGYKFQVVEEEMKRYPENIILIENKEYLTTNNMESCRIGIKMRKSPDKGCLIINGDCAYSQDIIRRVYESDRSCIATDSSIFNEENMKILISNDKVTAISKSITEKQGGITSIDLYNFSAGDLEILNSIIEKYNQSGDRNKWTEVAINDLFSIQGISIQSLDIAGEKWIEIDNHDDLEMARNLWRG
ncbi:MAG: hypothetical protein CMB75_01655 [Euryarchaeota archaeon]|nr:hypothetical protein [Euryarchaeota archaeon]|tara:strand:+ start:1889 stop:2611 length:723 start_codon:yes stop_codon:yes gene_type:complete